MFVHSPLAMKRLKKGVLELANLARKKKREEKQQQIQLETHMSTFTSPPSAKASRKSPGLSPIGNMADLGSPPNPVQKLTGASYEDFMESRLDFRHWGTRTYQ